MLLNKTSSDTIAIWMPTFGFNLEFIKPILLSTGVGIDNFINIDPPAQNLVQRTTLNGVTYTQVRQVIVTGSVTFNPSSTALSALREITEYQDSKRLQVKGIGLFINPSALLVDTYKGMEWTGVYMGPNRNKTMSDVSMTFSANPPTAISLGGLLAVPGIANVLNGFGVF